jgi:hypothetical protein
VVKKKEKAKRRQTKPRARDPRALKADPGLWISKTSSDGDVLVLTRFSMILSGILPSLFHVQPKRGLPLEEPLYLSLS